MTEQRDVRAGVLNLRIADEGGRRLIRLSGELDLANAASLETELDRVLGDGGGEIVVDLEELSFIDSTALGVLIAAQRRMHDDARLAIVCTHPQVLNVFEITGIDTAFKIHAARAAALAHVQAANARA